MYVYRVVYLPLISIESDLFSRFDRTSINEFDVTGRTNTIKKIVSSCRTFCIVSNTFLSLLSIISTSWIYLIFKRIS